MAKFYFKQLFVAALLLFNITAFAANFEIDGITYIITDETNLTVEAGTTDRYIEVADIPATVTYEDVTYKVTAISKSGFNNRQYLTTVSIPEGVTTIGDNAFSGCSALTEIVIPEGVTTIGVTAFANCSALKEVTIPKSLKSVGGGAFNDCSAITTVNICDLKAWCEIDFSGALTAANGHVSTASCTANPLFNLISSLPEGTYGGFARTYNAPRDLVLNGEKIVNLVIPAGIRNIACHFAGCSAESISFEKPDENTPEIERHIVIRAESFSGMTNLKKVELPDFDATIGGSAFIGCNNLEELTICKNYNWAAIDNGMSQFNCPEEIEVFQGCTHLKTLIIKEGVNTLEDIFGPRFSYSPPGTRYETLEIDSLCIPDLTTVEPRIRPKTIDYTNEAAWYNSTLDLSRDCEVLIAGEPVKEKSGELIIPDGVKAIYGEKINGANINKVVLPGSVTDIHNGAFAGCTELSEINIPESVTYIGKGAFDNTAIYNNCTDNLLYIDNWLVGYKGDNLGDITIKEGTKNIADETFASCTHLTGIEIANSISRIEDSAFGGCTALTNIDFGSGVAEIGSGAFYGCTSLKSITIPDNVTQINNETFYGCTSLAEIKFHKGITKIGSNAFENTAWYNNCADGLLYLNNWLIGSKGEFAQETLNVDEGTIGIADGASFRNLTTVVLPQSLAYIGEYAFRELGDGCTFISHATTPPAIEDNSILITRGSTLIVSIGKGIIEAYDHYRSYFSNIIARNTIGDFEYAPGWEGYVSWEENTVAINKYLGNDSNVVIPESIEVNGEVFDVAAISNAAFIYNTTLTNITIPNSITNIGSSAFNGCTTLASIDIPNSVTTIRASAFEGCTALESVNIPYNLETIEERAFSGCTALTSIDFPSSVTTIGASAFEGCTALESVNLPANLETIEENTFSGCSALTSIDIPDNVTTIGASAFSRCTALTRLYIPESVSTIEAAFTSCNNITEIYSNSTTPAKIRTSTFSGTVRTNATLYIPAGSLSAYKAASARLTWGKFSNIVEMDFTGIYDIEAEDSFQGAKDVYYDLNGRIAVSPTKGIYIINGKKIVIE